MTESAPSSEEQRESEIFNHKQHTAELLGVSPDDVSFQYMGDKFERRGFYNYFFSEGQKEAFVKTGRTPEANTHLRREAASAQIAKDLNIPIKQAVPLKGSTEFDNYSEKDEVGVLGQELLSGDEWTFLVTPEMIEHADNDLARDYGSALAEIAMTKLGNEIPTQTSIEPLRHDQNADWRYRSPELCNKVWQESSERVIANLDVVYPSNLEEEQAKIAALAAEGIARMDFLVANSPAEEGKHYFVHGDFDANNICLKPDGTEYRVLDFEHAGASQYQPLARLTDVSNCFGRCRPNPVMQESFIRESMRVHKEKSHEDAYHLLRSAIIFGTLYLAKFGMDPNHGEHPRVAQQLKQLDHNLKSLDDEYMKISSDTNSSTAQPAEVLPEN